MIKRLREKATGPEEAPERLVFLLQQTAKYELTMLCADYFLSQNGMGHVVPLTQGFPIRFDEQAIQITPETRLGLSALATPDFIIPEPVTVIGEVKSGIHLQPFHLNTIAGYAIAYESQHQQDVNWGIVYFFETHAKQVSFAQSYVFVIDDILRRGFLDLRNEAYRTIQQDKPPALADFEKHCQFSKYKAVCHEST
jgi:CRISPR/Cas system-associated exonuclease Cas4 (RecB family)